MLSSCEFYLFNLGHEESYNPPPEYLPTKEEVREMRWIVSQLTTYAYIFSLTNGLLTSNADHGPEICFSAICG